ncbi:glycosyltransferase [Thermodesulfobacteriota bacterium]
MNNLLNKRENPFSVLTCPEITSDCVAIIVTYNRKNLLIKSLKAHINQDIKCDIILIDNASTDGSCEYVMEQFYSQNKNIHYIRLGNNLGGAGGFHFGMKYALANNWQWFWLMDDDAQPDKDALSNLRLNANRFKNIYGSAAVGFGSKPMKLCWPAEILKSKHDIRTNFIGSYDQLKDVQELSGIPFLGFFIHRDLVYKIGLPDPNFFIYSDDKEYCERAKKNSAKIILIKNSIIYHPMPLKGTTYKFLNNNIVYRSMPPWKLYYYVRNKIIVGKKYYGKRFITQTIPGIIFRIIISMLKEQRRLSLLFAYIMAFVDGFAARTPRRLLPPV